MKSIRELRQQQYDYHIHNERFHDLNDWRRSPYTYFKTRFYMELSAIVVYCLLKVKIKPNVVTITYILLGILGGVLLAIPTNVTVLIAIFIFFTKGILDWSDGHLARITNQTSVTGDILDLYGAVIGAVVFQIGLGFYVAEKSGMHFFYYLIPLIPFLYIGRLHYYAFSTLFRRHLTPEKIREYSKKDVPGDLIGFGGYKPEEGLRKKYGRVYNIAINILDDRARTVDFVCFLLLLEMFTPVFITWIIFLGFLARQFLIFTALFYIIARGNWAEKQLEKKAKELWGVFASDK